MATIDPAVSDRLARNVLTQRIGLRPKENVLIESWPTALPWANAFVREARRMGAKPLLLHDDEASYWNAVESGGARDLGRPGDHEWAALEKADVYVFFWGPEDRKRARALPPKTAEQVTAFNDKWYATAARTGLRGVRMELARVTPKNAQYYGVDPAAWEREIVEASLHDPRTYDRSAAKVRKAFETGKELRIRHSNGTDVTLGLLHREPRVFNGLLTPESRKRPFGSMASVPTAAVVVALDESTAEGTVVSNRINYLPTGRVSGGRWNFSNGHLASAKYASGGARFTGPYAKAKAGRDLPGILEVGLEPAIHIAPELEDCELGAVTLGVGGNASFGGQTKSDFNSWLTIGGAELSVDGRPIVRGGRIL